MARKIIVANWKMNLGGKDGILFARALLKELEFHGFMGETCSKKVVLCSPATLLDFLGELLIGTQISLGAQNCGVESYGPFTGEIGASMIKDWGAEYVILGHSERRIHFGESNKEVALKVQQALNVELTPILCVGETLEEKGLGRTEIVIQKQLDEGLGMVDGADIIIAYEPVWAIGTGKIPTLEDIAKIHSMIHDLYPKYPLLYGGSVNERNIADIIHLPHVNGVLVGKVSLNVQSFMSLLKNMEDK